MDGELLKQALMLTLIGMGMTFAAIGALVLGMYALGGIKPRKSFSAEEDENVEEPVVMQEEGAAPLADARYIAVAVAVAVARAQVTRSYQRPASAPVDQWRGYVRNRHLAQREH